MSNNNHSKLKRKIAIYTLIFVLAGVAARIAYVNITAEKPIIEYYSENEWAGLNGIYIRSWEENTEGYSVKIVGYEVMEKEKYFSKYDLFTLVSPIYIPSVRLLLGRVYLQPNISLLYSVYTVLRLSWCNCRRCNFHQSIL